MGDTLSRSRAVAAADNLPPLHHVQHSAYRCRDAEQTRWFYEDILGLPLSAAFVFGREEPGSNDIRFMHLFFDMGDGNHIAFFDEPAHASEDKFGKKHGFDIHIAFEVPTMEELELRRDRLHDAGIETSEIDHDFLNSVYFYDPNGLRLELTVKAPHYDQVMREAAKTAHAVIDDWTRETRATKVERIGADHLDKTPTTVALPAL